MSLEHLTRAARETEPAWNDDRSERVLASAIGRRERRTARARLLRRTAAFGGVVGIVCLVLLRGASASSPVEPSSEPALAHAEPLQGDGGYARD
jgi:hypothetical protein